MDEPAFVVRSPSDDFSRFTIPEHELLRPIAKGAYGEVWLARNVVGTLRAVKIVRRDRHESSESFDREFKGLQKFEPVSRSHDSLVDILALGLLPGGAGFYYVMELADDASTPVATIQVANFTVSKKQNTPDVVAYVPRTLRAHIKSQRALPADEVIAVGLKLTSALAHLHSQGLVHRDVKPSNILYVGGEPKLADAGLVADVEDARSLVGTAGYIAPEGPGTDQADLYALGKALYEAAFGKDRREFPALPADVLSRPDHQLLLELNEVIATACAHDPKQRYANANAMLRELESLAAGRSVKRQRSHQQILSHAAKLALACLAMAIAWGIVESRSNRLDRTPESAQQRQPEFVWSTNDLANEDFRKGVRTLHAARDNIQAIRYFENAIQKDPNFAEAYARLAWAHYSHGSDESDRKGPEAAEKAAQLNPQLAYAHSMLATAKKFKLKWAEADKERKLALSLNPNSQEILLESALNLASTGRTNEALYDLQKARRANPDSASTLRELFYGFVLGWCRDYPGALEFYARFPDRGNFVDNQRAQAYLALGDYTNAIRYWKKAALSAGQDAEQVNREFAALNKAFEEGGPHKFWQANLEFELRKGDSEHWMRLAAIQAMLEQPEEAFLNLRRAMKESPKSFSIGFYTNPSFDNLRKEKKFAEIVAELWRED